MLICKHRVNEPSALAELDSRFGVEMDVRSIGKQLVVVHDSFATGPDLDDWLSEYHHAFAVVNVKEEGLEDEIRRRFDDHGVEDWAFLDESFPYLIRTLRSGQTNTMVRVSEFEAAETALRLAPRPDWIWVDSFGGAQPDFIELRDLASAGFRFMAVSPELQGRAPEKEVPRILGHFSEAGVELHAVCTKRPDLWQ